MSTIEHLGRGMWWEKRGNTTWAQCDGCAGWFHIGDQMLAAAALHCPHCHAEFPADAARRIVKAD